MATPSIPTEVFARLLPLGIISSAEATALAQRLEQDLTPNLVVDDLVADIVGNSEVLTAYSIAFRNEIADAIMTLHFLYSAASWDRRAFSHELLTVAQIVDSTPPFDLKRFQENTEAFLATHSVRSSVKAYTLSTEVDSSFLASRIITDIRPVFGEELTLPLSGCIVIHSIKLTIRSKNEQAPIFLTSDTADLINLRDEIDRAIEKARILTSLLNGTPGNPFGKTLEQ